jgi:poly(3-hydroxybutyrate) depolymerase
MAGKRTGADRAANSRRQEADAGPPFPPKAYRRMRVAIWTGAADATVAPSNAAQLAAQFALLLGLDFTRLEREPSVDGRMETTYLRDAGGRMRIRAVTVADMDHAWSGGSPQGSFTYPAGPDASTDIFEFFSAKA